MESVGSAPTRSTTDAVDTFLATSAIRRDGAIAGGFVGGAAVRLGREADAELHVDSSALLTGIAGCAADAVHADEAAVVVGGAEVGGTVVHSAATTGAVATGTALRVTGATVDTRAVDADLAAVTVGVTHALTGRRRDLAAKAALALGAFGAGPEIVATLRAATTVDAKPSGATLEVELADVVVGSALSVEAGEAVGALAGVGAATPELATRDVVRNAHAVAADEAGITAIRVHRAGAGARIGVRLGGANAHGVATDGAIGAIRVLGALLDAADIGAQSPFRALVVAAAGGTLRRIDLTTTQAIAVEAARVVAEVAVGTTAGEREKRRGKDSCENQTHR